MNNSLPAAARTRTPWDDEPSHHPLKLPPAVVRPAFPASALDAIAPAQAPAAAAGRLPPTTRVSSSVREDGYVPHPR